MIFRSNETALRTLRSTTSDRDKGFESEADTNGYGYLSGFTPATGIPTGEDRL